jgi:hypothetical protein
MLWCLLSGIIASSVSSLTHQHPASYCVRDNKHNETCKLPVSSGDLANVLMHTLTFTTIPRPDELLLEILAFIGRWETHDKQSTLARFCSVNRQWYDVASMFRSTK